jgi:outer membrane protein
MPIQAAAQSTAASLPLWEIGGFGVGVSQQAYPGSDQQVNRGLALPFLVYRGQFLRADRESAGLRAIKTPRFELDIGVAGSFGANSDDIDARRGMSNLGTLVEFGPRVKWNLGAGPGAVPGGWSCRCAAFSISASGANTGAWPSNPGWCFNGARTLAGAT